MKVYSFADGFDSVEPPGISSFILSSQKGVAGGVAPLGPNNQVPAEFLPPANQQGRFELDNNSSGNEISDLVFDSLLWREIKITLRLYRRAGSFEHVESLEINLSNKPMQELPEDRWQMTVNNPKDDGVPTGISFDIGLTDNLISLLSSTNDMPDPDHQALVMYSIEKWSL